MNLITDTTDFDRYFAEQQVDRAKVRPASAWVDAVIDRHYGEKSSKSWTATGFDKMFGKFDLRPGELTIWAGINKHGKTTFLSNVMLNVMERGKRVCIASMEMPPDTTMDKMVKQAAGIEKPTEGFIRGFGKWTDSRLWIYDHTGKLAAGRVLALATYIRKEMGIDHLVVDSLMKCGIGVDDYTGQKDFVDALSTICRDTGLHIHLVCHMRKGETEKAAPDKFAVKGASELADMPDNIVIVWKNLRKADDLAAAEREKNQVVREQKVAEVTQQADAFVRIAGQRHHPYEGSFAFWFDKGSQQFRECHDARARYLDLELGIMR